MKQNRFGYDVGLEFIRHLIDDGKVFSFSFRVASGSTAINYRLKTGVNRVSLSLYAGASAKTTIDIIEDPTVTTPGTASKLYNQNRNFADDTLAVKLFTGSVFTAGTGTQFRWNQAGFGTVPGQASSSDASPGSGYQLKPNTEYEIVVTPTSAEFAIIGELFEIGK